MALQHKTLQNIPKMLGFVMENVKAGDIAKLLCRTFVTSEDPAFFNYIQGITKAYLNEAGYNEQFVSNFLVIHHEDFSVDVYVNELPIAVEFLSKRTVKKGEEVYESDIADIRRLRFQHITIKNTDHIVFCFKNGWKHGLFFDFTYDGKPQSKINLDKLYFDLGYYYKKLTHHYLFQVVENTSHFAEMQKDGWFPYVEIIGNDYRELSKAYKNKFNYPDILNNLINSFTEKRISKITSKWWKNSLYRKKQKILQAGVNSYLSDNEEGYINCIKNLYSEIEGILGYLLFEDTNQYTVNSQKLLEHLKDKGLSRGKNKNSLLFPVHFSTFLQGYLFPQFDLLNNNIDLSRHTSSHGVAEAKEYTRVRALQAILILDQIYFYLPPNKQFSKKAK